MSAPYQGRILLRLMIARVVKRNILTNGLATVIPFMFPRQYFRHR